MASDSAVVFHMHVPCDKTLNFEILTLGFDDDGHLWNLHRTGVFVFHNTSCFFSGKDQIQYRDGGTISIMLASLQCHLEMRIVCSSNVKNRGPVFWEVLPWKNPHLASKYNKY
jgi:hypothetical protein